MVDKVEVARYHTFTNEEKDQYWIKESGKSYHDISISMREEMMCVSRRVKAYLNANDKERDQLWHQYDFYTRCFCDSTRWHDEIEKRRQIEQYAKKLLPQSEISILIK